MANDLAPWTPPESKETQWFVKWIGGALALLVGAYVVKTFAPTYIDAINLLTKAFASMTSMVITGGVMIGTCWFAFELLSPTGSINKMLRVPYWSFINGMTRYFVRIDPLSPIDQRIKSVTADRNVFETNFERLDGVISSLQEKEERYRGLSVKAQALGAQAAKRANSEAAFDVAAHQYGSYRDTANDFAAMRKKLEPARATFLKISQSCDITIQKLETERSVLKDKLEASQAVAGAVNAAGRVLGRTKSQEWALAEQAEDIINNKYGEELGHLDHLKRFADPFIQSIDVENATYSDELLQQLQSSGTKLLTSAAATPLPAQVASSPAATTSLIR